MVPKSAYGWPLMALRAAGPCVLLRTLSASNTVLKSPVAEALARSRAVPTAYWLGVCAPAAKADLEQVQKHVVCVVGERGRQEGEVACNARERAADTAARRQDRVGRLACIGPALRQHLNAAAVERRRTAGDDPVGLPGRIGFDLVDRAGAKLKLPATFIVPIELPGAMVPPLETLSPPKCRCPSTCRQH